MNTTARHVAIILDGNRRFARAKGLEGPKGHQLGLLALRKIIRGAFTLGVRELTLYVFSAQNFNRSATEVGALFALMRKSAQDMLSDDSIARNKIRIRCVGNQEKFPADLRSLMRKLEEQTKTHDGPTINLCIGYGGREEILDAVRRMCREVKQGLLEPSSITEQTVQEHLWLSSEPDIVIRTGGEVRTSNYLPWQSVYSEWFFEKKLWPEFTLSDLRRILKEYSQRKRRFGK